MEKLARFTPTSLGTLKARKQNNVYRILRKRKCKPRSCGLDKVLFNYKGSWRS